MIVIQSIDTSKRIHARVWNGEDHFKRNQKAYGTYETTSKNPEKMCAAFNAYLEKQRKKYNDMFLGSFYENSRKYIPFTLVCKMFSAI